MDKGTAVEHQGLLLAELARVQKLARKVEAEQNQHSPNESCKLLLQELHESIEKSICMINSSGEARQPEHPNADGGSPRSSGESSRSETSKLTFKDQMTKKRKTLPKWTSEVREGSGAGGVVGPIDDGHSWRKYGQKDILGAKHPRGYYRCTHRITQGCPATKQVQRSDEDPLLFHVTYHGHHTCLQKHQVAPTSAQSLQEQQQQQQQQQQHDQDLLLSFQTGLRVKTEDLEQGARGQTSASFSFGPRPEAGSENENLFVLPSTPESCFVGRASSTFLSPATLDSTYFSLSPCGFDGGAKLQSPESGVTTGANSAAYMDFMLQELYLEPDFSSFFS